MIVKTAKPGKEFSAHGHHTAGQGLGDVRSLLQAPLSTELMGAHFGLHTNIF